MPNKASAKKRVRQAAKRRIRNMAVRSEIRTLAKQCRQAIAKGELTEARDLARRCESRLDRAAKHNIMHKNTAQRLAQRLHKAVSAAVAASAATE